MSTLRDVDTRKAILLERLLRSWEKRPDLGFAELVGLALAGGDPRAMKDEELCVVVERFVMFNPEPPKVA